MKIEAYSFFEDYIYSILQLYQLAIVSISILFNCNVHRKFATTMFTEKFAAAVYLHREKQRQDSAHVLSRLLIPLSA